MLEKVASIFKIRDLRRKVLATLGLLAVFRLVASIPVPGVDANALQRLFAASKFLGILDMFSGGAMQQFSVAALGLNPFINASIMLQLLTMVFPKLEELSREGEYGRQRIEQYTRFLTIPLALIQGWGAYALLGRQGIMESLPIFSLVALVLTLAGGTMFLVWLGGLISEYGVGNGTSIIICAGILSRVPLRTVQLASVAAVENMVGFPAQIVLLLGLLAAVVVVSEGTRQVEIRYARRVRGQRSYGGTSTYLPLRVNQAGMMPIMFAASLVLIPSMVARFVGETSLPVLSSVLRAIPRLLSPGGVFYNLLLFLLVVGFTYFYTAVSFDPGRIADDIKKHGGFIPGIRPGKATASYLNWILVRITLVGGIFLGIVAVFPSIVQSLTGAGGMIIEGAGLLIVVSVVLETLKRVEARVVMSDYDGFL